MRSSYSPNPKKNNFREPSPLSWKVANSKATNINTGGKYKGYSVSKTKSQKSTKSCIKSKKQSAVAIQNYFDNSKMLLNNSATYAMKNSSKKQKKRGVVGSKASKYNKGDDLKSKNCNNSGWEMLANLSSSSRERKYSTNNFTKSKKVVTDELFNDTGDNKNVCLVNIKQPFNMYNTTHNFMAKSTNHSFNLSYNLGGLGTQEKKNKKYVSTSSKHQKQGVYSSYSNMTKKKHPRASSNTQTNNMNLSKQEEYLSRSSKKNNILFKLASELSQSPEKGKNRKTYSKELKKKGKKYNMNNLYKAIPGFVGD